VVFVEIFRLLLVLMGALAGYEVGYSPGSSSSTGQVVGLLVGAFVAYVIGGLLGRALRTQSFRAALVFDRIPPDELAAGTLTGILAFLLGATLCVPLLVFVHTAVVWLCAAAFTLAVTFIGFRIGMAKGRHMAVAGLGRILGTPAEPLRGYALLVDPSALMTPYLLVLGRYGLLVGGLVVPRFVIDQLQTLAAWPDPVSSRRAQRGLDRLDALRDLRVRVHVVEHELPEIEDLTDRLVEVARRSGLRLMTCSGPVKEAAEQRGVAVTDLRPLAADLIPDYMPGEQLLVDLVKEGNQPRQAAGYLADGDVAIVSEAAHMIGREHVVIEVQSTQRTNQGLLVFAKLADGAASVGPVLSNELPGPSSPTDGSTEPTVTTRRPRNSPRRSA
jgi:uncharacterized protein YacL